VADTAARVRARKIRKPRGDEKAVGTRMEGAQVEVVDGFESARGKVVDPKLEERCFDYEGWIGY